MKVITEFPIAYESADHIEPSGTMRDNTHHKFFVRQTARIFKDPLVHIDLGCSGGGLVKDFIDYGYKSIGIEGSDFSLKNKRAEWATIPDSLFTADITKPFEVVDDEGQRVKCNVITAWEVMEHIKVGDLPGLLDNINKHLSDDGIFVASVATFPDGDYHVTLEQEPWWLERFAENGLVPVGDPLYKEEHMVRKSSFYLVMKKG
jgi:predicted TPR repeat methyltransferase